MTVPSTQPSTAAALAERTLALVDIPSPSREEMLLYDYVTGAVPLPVAHDDGESVLYLQRAGKPLVLLAGLPTAVAVGTSLMVTAMQTLAGLVAQPGLADIPWQLVLPFIVIAVAGSFLGSALTGRILDRALRIAFAVLVLVVAAVIGLQQLPLLIAPA